MSEQTFDGELMSQVTNAMKLSTGPVVQLSVGGTMRIIGSEELHSYIATLSLHVSHLEVLTFVCKSYPGVKDALELIGPAFAEFKLLRRFRVYSIVGDIVQESAFVSSFASSLYKHCKSLELVVVGAGDQAWATGQRNKWVPVLGLRGRIDD